jgi:ribonuclease R
MKNKKKEKTNKLSAKELKKEILKLFREDPKKRFNPKQVAMRLRSDNNKDSVQHALQQLVEEKFLVPLDDFKYQLARGLASSPAPGARKAECEGIVDMTRSGAADTGLTNSCRAAGPR